MNAPSPAMRQLARRLLDASHTAGTGNHGGPSHHHNVVAMYDTLRRTLTRFAGEDGTAALMRRAIAMAAFEAPALQGVRVVASCEIEGLEAVAAAEGGADSAVALTVHILDLLATFIGEALTLRLVREGWPDVQDIRLNKDRLS